MFSSPRSCWSAAVRLAVLGLVLVLVGGHTDQEYCDAFGPDNTMCKYPNGTTGCPSERSGTDSATIDDIISSHNMYRQTVATGQQSPQPSASNMYEMIWDEELAAGAQRWADQCAFGHDANRDAFDFPEGVGQNVAAESVTPTWNDVPEFGSWAIPTWYSEVDGFDPSGIDPYEGGAGHYTQVVWATSYAVGCGYLYYEDDGWQNKYYVCNYGPAGNWIGEAVYQTGTPCSACENGGPCSTNYDGLCAPPTDASGKILPVRHPGAKQIIDDKNFLIFKARNA